jgi:hypothetical protein
MSRWRYGRETAQTPRSQGTSASYICDRLRRENRTDLADAVAAGTISAFAAAEAAGYVRRPQILGTGSRNQARKRQHQFRALAKGGDNALSKMQELWLGPSPEHGSLFNSREELEQAWQMHRTEVMRLWGSHGRRPMGWWEFEAADLEHPGYDLERSTLWHAGVLGPEEKLEVERSWEVEFAAARGMGARERREHLAFHDVPAELIREWTAERRRRPRAIRNPPVEAQEKAPDAATEGQEKSMSFRPQLSAAAKTLE